MSLLDDLKKEVVTKSNQEEEASQVSKKDRDILLSKMSIIREYYSELAENLNILLPDEKNDFDLTKEVVFKELQKTNYIVKHRINCEKESVYFHIDQVGKRKVRVNLTSLNAAEKFRSLLKNNRIDYSEQMESDSRLIFTVEPKVTARFDYLANFNKGLIELKITNFNEIWTQNIRHSPEKITNELLDETAKFILGKTNKFKEMTGGTISDTARTRIQQHLKKDPEEANTEKKVAQKKDKSIMNFGNTASKLKGLLKK